jgi:anaerobic magnesium-protoporphyrin IX monomethyl ester cyclase
MWNLASELLNAIRAEITKNSIPVIVGGVFATFAPDLVIKHPLVNIICVGEGEEALLELCTRIGEGRSHEDVTNLWVQTRSGEIKKNSVSAPYDIEQSPIIDISLFETARLYRPMAGKWYKMLPIETIRGCPYKCAFCNSPNQIEFYKQKVGGGFYRKKSANLIYDELKFFKDTIGLEYAYFWADTFLAQNNREFDEFCEIYSEIKLPFWFQTRPETLTDEKIRKLKEVGLHRIAFGLEHGNEGFRKKYLARDFPNGSIVEKLKIPKKYDVAFSVNNITGFPYEDRSLAFDTVELNRQIQADNQNLYAFVPFHGTPLRRVVEKLGYLRHEDITKSLTDKPMLDQPQYPAQEVAGLQKCFVLYVTLPKSRWKYIREAEKDTDEGNRLFESLKQEHWEIISKDKKGLQSNGAADLEYGIKDGLS